MRDAATSEADAAYAAAENEPAPRAESANTDLFGPTEPDGHPPPFALDDTANTMAGALNVALREALSRVPEVLLFGEDVEDPKGGVFGFTKGLSTRFPGRVVNSPLAEATIVGMGVGLAATGWRPIFEMQFIDFIAPAFNQLLNQAATLRWRSNGDWTCPAIFYAPYGAYLPAGSTWHSQSNEGFWTHIPGLRVAVPSTPADLAGLLWSALKESDPTLLLIPKHIMRVRHEARPPPRRGFGRARIVQEGEDVTVVTWGNFLEIVQKAAADRASRCSISRQFQVSHRHVLSFLHDARAAESRAAGPRFGGGPASCVSGISDSVGSGSLSAVQRSAAASAGVLGTATSAGNVRPAAFVRLAVPGAARGQVGAVGRVEDRAVHSPCERQPQRCAGWATG